MIIHSIFSDDFRSFGCPLDCPGTKELVNKMMQYDIPQDVSYEASMKNLESCSIYKYLEDNVFGGTSIQIGLCWGKNTRLNCLEYHKNSEVNIGDRNFVLMVAERKDITNGKLDTSKVKLFWVPAFQPVELYATTLHYAPVMIGKEGFRVAIVLPKGTNTEKPLISPISYEDRMLFAKDKWLIAHPDTHEAKEGAFVGLVGKNIDLENITYKLEQ